MIDITRINGKELTLNSELIESIESNPDTTISMTTGKKFIVKETKDEVINKVIEFKRNIYSFRS